MRKNNFLILASGALLSIVLLLILSNEASAVLVPEAMVSNFVKPITQFLFDIIKQLLTGLIYFLIASTLFSFSVNNSPKMLDLQNSDFVQTGLSITTALADILLIAVFIAIALGTVFNNEAINAKKHFIKFFIAALLIHFAPLFVGMMIDIGNIIMSGLVVGSGHAAFSSIINNFAKQIIFNLLSISTAYGGMAVVSAVPGANIVAGIGLAVGFLATAVFLPGVLIQIMIMGILTGLLFSFAIFFLTRVFMIQILAVLAPLAILSSVLPQTASHFKTWLSWLIGWSLGGVLLLFLLTLGLTTAGGFLPSDIDFSPEGFTIGGFLFSLLALDHIKWIALAVYMITIQTICAAAIPEISGKVSGEISKGMGGAAGKIGQGFKTGKDGQNLQAGIMGGVESFARDRFGTQPAPTPSGESETSKHDKYDPSYG